MNIKKNMPYLFAFAILFSCQSKKEEIKNLLSNGNVRWWVLKEYALNDGHIRREEKEVLRFTQNRKFNRFRKKNNILTAVDYKSDDMLPNEWDFRNDSVLILNYEDFTIVKITKDTLILKQHSTKNIFTYCPELNFREYKIKL